MRSVTGLRTSSLSEMEVERLRFFTFRFPPIEGSDPSVASDASDVLEAKTASVCIEDVPNEADMIADA